MEIEEVQLLHINHVLGGIALVVMVAEREDVVVREELQALIVLPAPIPGILVLTGVGFVLPLIDGQNIAITLDKEGEVSI